MSTPIVNAEPAAASARTDAAPAGAVGTAGEFQGSATEIVSSKSNAAQPEPGASAQISAWKLGNKGRSENLLAKSLKGYAEAARSQALARQSASGPQQNAGKAKSMKKSLLSIFKSHRQPAAAPAGNKEERLGSLAENDRVILQDAEASVLIRQAGTMLSGTDVIPHARAILQKPDNREELTDFFLQKLEIKGKSQTQKRHFRNISTALTAAECIADTKNAGRRIMQAGHPDMDRGRQAKFAERIELGTLILARLQDVRYVPERSELQQLTKDGNFNSFGDTKLRNPYLELVKNENFTATDEQHIRSALLDALKLTEDCTELVADSALGEESAVNSEQLIEQAGRCGIRISASKETTFADEVQTETTFQVADAPPPPTEAKLETTV